MENEEAKKQKPTILFEQLDYNPGNFKIKLIILLIGIPVFIILFTIAAISEFITQVFLLITAPFTLIIPLIIILVDPAIIMVYKELVLDEEAGKLIRRMGRAISKKERIQRIPLEVIAGYESKIIRKHYHDDTLSPDIFFYIWLHIHDDRNFMLFKTMDAWKAMFVLDWLVLHVPRPIVRDSIGIVFKDEPSYKNRMKITGKRKVIDLSRETPPETVEVNERTIEKVEDLEPSVKAMITMVFEDLKNGWMFLQASPSTLDKLKDLMGETTEKAITSREWNEYFSADKKEIKIATTNLVDQCKDAFRMNEEFKVFSEFTLDSEELNLLSKPSFFHGTGKKEAKKFVGKLKVAIQRFLDETIKEEFKT